MYMRDKSVNIVAKNVYESGTVTFNCELWKEAGNPEEVIIRHGSGDGGAAKVKLSELEELVEVLKVLAELP